MARACDHCEVFFDTAAMLLAFVVLGKYLEVRAGTFDFYLM